MTLEEGNGTVRFTTKELLNALDVKLDRILEKLEGKASKASVNSLEGRVTMLETWRNRMVGAFGVLGLVGPILAVLVSHYLP